MNKRQRLEAQRDSTLVANLVEKPKVSLPRKQVKRRIGLGDIRRRVALALDRVRQIGTWHRMAEAELLELLRKLDAEEGSS